MKFLASQTKDRQKLFFGDADSFTLIHQKIPRETVLRELKLSCLLYDHVVLAAAYFWQSNTMRSLMPHVETFIQNGDLLPAIRDYSQTSNASDYLERRIEETSVFANQSPIYRIPAIASEIAKPEQRPMANELGRNQNVVMSRFSLHHPKIKTKRLSSHGRGFVCEYNGEWEETLDRILDYN